MHFTYLHQTGEASRGVHGLPKITPRDATKDNGILRAPLPGQVLRRRVHSRRTVREIEGGCDQLQLQVASSIRALLCQCGF